jgi:hypothetical protein
MATLASSALSLPNHLAIGAVEQGPDRIDRRPLSGRSR